MIDIQQTSFHVLLAAVVLGVVLLIFIKYRQKKQEEQKSEEKKEKNPNLKQDDELIKVAQEIVAKRNSFKSVKDAESYVEKKTGAAVTFKNIPSSLNLLYVILDISRKVKVKEVSAAEKNHREEEKKEKVVENEENKKKEEEEESAKISFRKKKLKKIDEQCENGVCEDIS